MNLGWTSWAILWLRRVPAPIPDHVHVAYSSDEAVRAAYAKQAAHDWHEFIAFRGRELCPGGRLVVTTMALDDNGEFGYRPLFNGMADVLGELTATGLITRRNTPDVHSDRRASGADSWRLRTQRTL